MFIPSAIRKAVDLPVVGVGRFKDPIQAERALQEGHCDLVGVVRGQIADAEMHRVFNCGIGMVVVMAPDDADEAITRLSAQDETVCRIGEIVVRPVGESQTVVR